MVTRGRSAEASRSGPQTACLQGGPGEDGERARRRHAACTVSVAGSDRSWSLGLGWGRIMRLINVCAEGVRRHLPDAWLTRFEDAHTEARPVALLSPDAVLSGGAGLRRIRA